MIFLVYYVFYKKNKKKIVFFIGTALKA